MGSWMALPAVAWVLACTLTSSSVERKREGAKTHQPRALLQVKSLIMLGILGLKTGWQKMGEYRGQSPELTSCISNHSPLPESDGPTDTNNPNPEGRFHPPTTTTRQPTLTL